MTPAPHLTIVRTLDERLRDRFARIDALEAELARERQALLADRALYMAREGTYGLRVEAIRKAVGA